MPAEPTKYDSISPVSDQDLHQVYTSLGDHQQERALTPDGSRPRSPRDKVGGDVPTATSTAPMSVPSRTKTVVAICVFILFTHVMVVLALDKRSASLNVGDVASELKQRSKRDLEYVSHGRGNADAQDASVSDSRSIEETLGFGSSGKCRNGHVQGLGPFCDPHGCLFKTQTELSATMSTGPAIPNRSYENLGIYRTSPQHNIYLFVSILSGIQRDLGLHGSLGFFDTNKSQFSEYFASTAEPGEHVLRWDTTSKSSKSQTSKLLVEYKTSDSNGRTIHLEDPLHLSKRVLVEESIPQFRLISVEDRGDVVQTVSSLESATCLLRDGGIVILHGNSASGKNALGQFFNKHGTGSVAPCFKLRGRYVLCTTAWKERIIEAFQSHSRLPKRYIFKRESGEEFGSQGSYLSMIA